MEWQDLICVARQIKRILRSISMSTSAVSSNSLSQPWQSYFQTRKSDMPQLGEALSLGNFSERSNCLRAGFQCLGKGSAIGRSGGRATRVRHAGKQFSPQWTAGPGTPPGGLRLSTISGSLLSNGGNSRTPERITINISNPGNGSPEPASLSGGAINKDPPELTFNLNPNNNE